MKLKCYNSVLYIKKKSDALHKTASFCYLICIFLLYYNYKIENMVISNCIILSTSKSLRHKIIRENFFIHEHLETWIVTDYDGGLRSSLLLMSSSVWLLCALATPCAQGLDEWTSTNRYLSLFDVSRHFKYYINRIYDGNRTLCVKLDFISNYSHTTKSFKNRYNCIYIDMKSTFNFSSF